MRFSENLIGVDIKISNEKLKVSRKDGSDPVNSSTIAFSSQPLTIKHMQSFIIDLDFEIYGFGKIGITAANPFNADLSKIDGVQNLCSSENQNCITEFPLYDTCTNSFINMEPRGEICDNTQVHLIIVLNSFGEVHYFINFKYKGLLFSEILTSISLWLFFDLSGCLTSVSFTELDGAPDPGICWHHDNFRTYYNECTKGSLFCYQSNLTIIHTSKLDEVLCDIFDCKCFEELLESKRISLKTTCNYATGSFTPQGFSNKSDEKPSAEKKSHWGYIGQADQYMFRDNSGLQPFDNKIVKMNEKLDLFEAEKLAFTIFKKRHIKNMNIGIKKSSTTDEISFTDLSTQPPTPLTEPDEELPSSIGIEKLSLIEKLMSFFTQKDISSEEVKVNGEICKVDKNHFDKLEKSYSTDSADGLTTLQKAEICIDLTIYRSLVQFQIILSMGVREPGAHLITIDIDQYVTNLDDKAQRDFVETLEQWLWILYQRGPDQVGPRSVLVILCYNKATLEVLNNEKLIPNIRVIKKIALDVCNRNEYKSIFNSEPIIFCPSSTNKAEQIDSIRRNVYNSICSSENIPRLIPKKWGKLINAILELNYQQTKLLSFNQICQMTDDHDCKNVDDLVTILSYLSYLGVIQWVGDKSFQSLDDPPSIMNSKIMESQASVVITDKQWLIKTIYGLEKDCKNYSDSMETLETVLKSFSYHKLLFILLLKYPVLAVENYKCQKLWTVFDFPLQPPITLFPISPIEKGVTIYFLFNQPIPWVFYLSLILASSKISSNQDEVSCDSSNGSIQVELEDCHEMVIYWISATTIAARICTSKYMKTKPDILVRVRQYMEQCIYQVASKNLHRLTAHTAIKCPCNTPCTNHNKRKCYQDYSCLHFLYLDEILCNQAVFCGRRRIMTAPWRELFPPVISKNFSVESRNNIINTKFTSSAIWNTESQLGCYLPQWMRQSAKILSVEESSFSWRILAAKLGYSDKIKKFEEDPNPALAMLVDWITTSGNNQLSVDFIILTLQEAKQYQISDIIESDPECQWLQPQIFISYQWHNQREAREISDHLHKVGFTTWMDVGQMGGGDLLMHRIERAIRGCKVLIACISPRYIVSTICHREIVLADLLKKPIIPVLVSPVPWPPPGGTGLMLAPYVYIDIFGVGGHGGTGLKSDLSSRFVEIESQVSKYCTPICNALENPTPSFIKTPDVSVQSSPKPYVASSHDHHSIDLHASSNPQMSALNTNVIPVTSQTSIRECSSICTFI